MRIHEINLQPVVGGGEIYTGKFTRAMEQAGAEVTLYVDSSNPLWRRLNSPRVEVVPVDGWRQIDERLRQRNAIIMTQSRVPEDLAAQWSQKHLLTGFAHMPMLGRSAAEFSRYSTVFTVSKYCIDLLRQAGISSVYPEPLYGSGEVDRDAEPMELAEIRARSPYHWDKRKGRDRILSLLEPMAWAMRNPPIFSKRPGLSLGIVSLLSPIKQFPALFALIAPKIAQVPGVHLEIFGNGGYAQVRDLREALGPVAKDARFWGYQQAVASIYPRLDYLLTGFPDKEALGLNVLEAQAAGTPVLAPRAPPFTETIIDGVGGFLYTDPRQDDARSFESLLRGIQAGRPRPDPRVDQSHLDKFSFAAMVDRAGRVLEHLHRESGAKQVE